MSKAGIIVAGVLGGAVIVGGGVYLATKSSGSEKSSNTNSSQQKESTKDVAINDPNGDYKLFSDPSVTKHIKNGSLYGNGETITFTYDGSKTNNDEYATLSYQLYYADDKGLVHPMGGGNIDGRGQGDFTLTDTVYNSSADGKKGFFELIGTYDSSMGENGITAKTAKLGMYEVVFKVTE